MSPTTNGIHSRRSSLGAVRGVLPSASKKATRVCSTQSGRWGSGGASPQPASDSRNVRTSRPLFFIWPTIVRGPVPGAASLYIFETQLMSPVTHGAPLMVVLVLLVLALFVLQTLLPNRFREPAPPGTPGKLSEALGNRDHMRPLTVTGERATRA